MQGDGAVDGSVPGPGDQGRQGGRHVAVVLAGDPAGAQEEALQAPGPVFLLGLDEGPELAQAMGAAGTVAHPFESEAGGQIVMDDDAFELLVETATSGGGAQDGERQIGRASCRERVEIGVVGG